MHAAQGAAVALVAVVLVVRAVRVAPPPSALGWATGGARRVTEDAARCGCVGVDGCGTRVGVGALVVPSVGRGAGDGRAWGVRSVAAGAWDQYVESAWGFDELVPVSDAGEDSLGGVGATVVEALGTLYLMKLETRYRAARDWVAANLDFEKVGAFVSVHEVTTRILGGLLSAYQLTGDHMFLAKAEDLGRRLAPAFDSSNGVPYPRCRLSTAAALDGSTEERAEGELDAIEDDEVCIGDATTQSEAGGLSLEFRALAYHSLVPSIRALRCKSDRAVQAVVEAGPSLLRQEIADELTRLKDSDGSAGSGKEDAAFLTGSSQFSSMDSYYSYMVEFWHRAIVAIGAGPSVDTTATFSKPARAFYEYLTKAWRQGGGCESSLRFPLDASMHMLLRRAIYESPTGDLYLRTFDKQHDENEPVVDQSMCYLPAVFHLAAKHADISPRTQDQWLDVAEGITKSCVNMYERFPGGLGGDSVRYNGHFWITKGAYQLQADLVEALFYMWRGTGSQHYRDVAWRTLASMERRCRLPNGAYTVLHEPSVGNITRGDRMPSEFLGATLKFLYLTFSNNDVLPLNDWVFNRAGHPLVVSPGIGALNPCT